MVFAGLKKKNERAGMLKNHLINEGMPGKKVPCEFWIKCDVFLKNSLYFLSRQKRE